MVSAFAYAFLHFHFFTKSSVESVDKLPIAFWSWGIQSPSDTEVRRAFETTNVKTLFLRAGQIETAADGSLHRIRPVQGRLPSSAGLHFVYNGTRKFLKEFGKFEPDVLARTVADTFIADIQRADSDGARVEGLQLDFDVPTRLLPKYTHLLRLIREFLPPDKKLSITGLPTWASSNDIEPLLAAVDFWIPQFYGAAIPTHAAQRIPISSASSVAREVNTAARLNKPFYAGLSAYGYAILYASDGSLVELRGDIDPAIAANNDGLELVEKRTLEKSADTSEARYVYRAKRDIVIDGLIIKNGETLVFDVPSAASLRASGRAVRENGGPSLLGICVFRLPAADDETALTVSEIHAALSDSITKVSTTIAISGRDRQLKLRAANTGTASTLISDDAFTIDLTVPPGSVSGLAGLDGFGSYETLCSFAPGARPSPCSQRRANVIRFRAKTWKPASRAKATISLIEQLPAGTTALVTTRVDDGRVERETIKLNVINVINE